MEEARPLDSEVGEQVVLGSYVRLEVALVLAAVRAVGALQRGRLAALHLDVDVQVALPAVHLAALRAGELARTVAGLTLVAVHLHLLLLMLLLQLLQPVHRRVTPASCKQLAVSVEAQKASNS